MLISASGPAVIGHDLRLAGSPWLNRLGDLSVLISLVLPLAPLLALLRLTDGLLPIDVTTAPAELEQLLRQAFTLVLLELLLVLGGVGLIQSLSWMLGRWSTALAGLSVLLGGLVLLAGFSARSWPCPYWCTNVAEPFRRWTAADNWFTAMASRCLRCSGCFWGSICWD